MKYVFVGGLIVMTILSGVAWLWSPGHRADSRVPLVWISDDNPVRREQIALFNRLHPEYELILDPQNMGMEKTIVQCLAGVGPDLFDCYNGFQLTAYVRSGIALDVTDRFEDLDIDVDAVWPALKPLVVLDDRAYGHPGNANAPALWYNKEIFERAGLPCPEGPWTWDEFLAVAQQLTQFDARGRPQQFGLLMSLGDWVDVLIPQWGASVYVPEGTRSALDSPQAAEAAQFYMDLIHKYHVAPSPTQENAMATAGGWGTGVITLFGAGRAAMAIGGRWWLCLLRNKDFADIPLGAVELPCGSGCQVIGGGRSTLVNAKGENIAGALTFLKFMHGPDWNNLVNRQADALAPVMAYNYTDEYLHNPAHPEEDYNAVWREAMEHSKSREMSPFVNGQTVDRILLKQGDLMRANVKTGAEAMRDTAREINKAIIAQLRVDPALYEQYMEAVAKGAPPAWDRPEDAP